MRTIGVITTSRADYGIYFPVLAEIMRHSDLTLQLYVTGSHLSAAHGQTIKFIKRDGFPIRAQVKVSLADDSAAGIAGTMGEVTRGFAQVFKKTRPDIVLVLGDRYEMHAAALAAVPFNIPLAHLHGGETTYGAIDELFRHSLTKLSHLHFPATPEFARRLYLMGEEPWRVSVSGAPGLDNLRLLPRMSRDELGRQWGFNTDRPLVVVTFHPVTLELSKTDGYIRNLLAALSRFRECSLVFTAPNADPAGIQIKKHLLRFVKLNSNATFVASFGQRGYVSLLAQAAAMVGNSSSGIIEAASFKLPVVNVGNRQAGRLRGRNVIDVLPTAVAIERGIKQALSARFKQSLRAMTNPYGDGHAARRIVQKLANVDLKQLLAKKFYEKIG